MKRFAETSATSILLMTLYLQSQTGPNAYSQAVREQLAQQFERFAANVPALCRAAAEYVTTGT